MGDFYAKLAEMEKASKKNQNAVMGWMADAMSSHPPSNARVNQAQEMRTLITKNGGVTVTPEFLEMKKLAQDIVANHPKK